MAYSSPSVALPGLGIKKTVISPELLYGALEMGDKLTNFVACGAALLLGADDGAFPFFGQNAKSELARSHFGIEQFYKRVHSFAWECLVNQFPRRWQRAALPVNRTLAGASQSNDVACHGSVLSRRSATSCRMYMSYSTDIRQLPATAIN